MKIVILKGMQREVNCVYKENGGFKIFKAVAIGSVIGMIFCSIMMLLLAFVLVKSGQLPLNAVYIILQVIGALSSFLGSYVAVRIYKSMGLLLGVITAFVMFLIVFAVGLSTCVEGVSAMTVTKLVSMLCAGAVGGILSVNKKKNINKYK